MNDRVLVARKRKNISQEKLAELVGLNHADIGRIEKHGWIPPAGIRKAISEALEQPEAELFDLVTSVAPSRP